MLFGSSVVFGYPFEEAGILNIVGGAQNAVVNVDNATFAAGPTFITSSVVLSSTGKGAAYIGGGSGSTLTNDTLIEGVGFIGADGLNLVNQGTLLANSTVGVLDVGAGGGFIVNEGAVTVAAGATLRVTGGANGFARKRRRRDHGRSRYSRRRSRHNEQRRDSVR